MVSVLINVGSSSSNPNGRGCIFKDFTFEYLPIPESERTAEKVPSYRELGFRHVRFPDLPVHLDPEFETFTYGHVRRGFGDVRSLLRLEKKDVLFFYATLQREDVWSTYIIGYFRNVDVLDCRRLSIEEILKLKSREFANNAHLKRVNPSVDLLIKGGKGSELLKKAFPLAEEDNRLELRKSLRTLIWTATGKKIRSGTPWFRWTLTCNYLGSLLFRIQQWQKQYQTI